MNRRALVASRALVAAVLTVGCERADSRASRDSALLAQIRPHLPELVGAARAIGTGVGKCRSPVPELYPRCERDPHGVLLLRELTARESSSVGARIGGIAYVPDRSDLSSLGSWYIGRLGAPLGAGWYQVTAITGLD